MNSDELFKQNPLFSDLSDQELNQLLQVSKEIHLRPNSYLLREGEIATEFYILIEGELEISKFNPEQTQEHVIAKLSAGDAIGELSLLDKKTRSASVKANTSATLFAISFEELKRLADKDQNFNKILLQIATNISIRLRQTNKVTLKAMEQQLQEYKLRTRMGNFMVQIIIAICLFTFALGGLTILGNSVNSTFINVPLTLAYLFLIIFIMRNSGLPAKAFGITTQNWRPAIYEAIIFTTALLILLTILKWVVINTIPSLSHHQLFEPYKFVSNHVPNPQLWSYTLIVYWLFVSPVQELIARGGLQSSLEVFLVGKNKILKAILTSNIMFSASHLYISFRVAVLVLFAGLLFGFLYARNRTLIGVTLAHALAGTYGFWILGM